MTHEPSSVYKKYALVALAALGALLAGAMLFYKERLFADTSFIAFNIINYGKMSIQNQRYGSFITQLFPFVGEKLHLPITAILFLYSISFNLFFFSAACLVVYRYKQYELAVLMAFFYLLMVSDSYFLENDELLQGIAWLFLALSVLFRTGRNNGNMIAGRLAFAVLSFLAVSSHFIVLIPLVYLAGYFLMSQNIWPFSKKESVVPAVVLVAVIALKFLLSQSGYENEHLQGVTHFSIQDIIDSFGKPVVQVFLLRCLTNYWLAVVILIAGITQLLSEKNRPAAIWTILFCIGYIVLMGLTYGGEDEHTLLAHIELEWQCLGIIAATPFVFSLLPAVKGRTGILLLAIIFAVRLFYIGAAAPKFIWRTHFQDDVLAGMRKKGITKLALYLERGVQTKYQLDWTACYESLFSSAVADDKPQLTFCFINKDDHQGVELLKNSTGFNNGFSILSPVFINNRYFNVDTTRTYQVMSYEEFVK